MTNKTLIQIVTITCCVVLAVFMLLPCGYAEEDRGEFYPLLTVVVNCEQDGKLWLVTCMDKSGNLWDFWEDTEPWEVGDLANLLMWNMGETLNQDEVIEVYYEGHVELWDLGL